jgi:hypothetical protein
MDYTWCGHLPRTQCPRRCSLCYFITNRIRLRLAEGRNLRDIPITRMRYTPRGEVHALAYCPCDKCMNARYTLHIERTGNYCECYICNAYRALNHN